MLKQKTVKVPCRLDYGRETEFVFLLDDESGIIAPNYCDNYHPCESCHKCANYAKKLLEEV